VTEVQVLRVFTDAAGAGGNHLGVVLDAEPLDGPRRQAIAAELGYAETIFIEDGARIAIYTPATELPFAGHPMVGAAWLLGVPTLNPPAGAIEARRDGDHAFIRARADQSPEWDSQQLAAPANVEAMAVPEAGHLQVWAWLDEGAGRIRARVFGPDYGVPEDPATGSAAIVLCERLRREITIEQGLAPSEIRARPLEDGRIELGGRVVHDSVRSL
jgi:predicted PhzF superfamily epimerase YddE/YHI9